MKTTFKMNGWTYTYNEPMTVNYGWPDGKEGERVRIKKQEIMKLLEQLEATATEAKQLPEPPKEATGLTINLPLDGFNPDSLDRLQKLIDSKASLIRKALGADRLTIQAVDGMVRLPWWDELPEPDETEAYMAFAAALGEMAKKQKRVTATEREVESEKYAFRCLLLRLGFIGEQFKAHRKQLMKNLSGVAAFANQAAADAFSAAQKAKQAASVQEEVVA